MKMIRVLLIPLLLLVLLTGQGFAAVYSMADACCPAVGMHQAMSCCHQGACEQHANSKSLQIKKKASACLCSPAPVDLWQENTLSPADAHLPVSALPAQPTLSLQVGDADAPIWLRRLYYPDKSALYQDKNSWLL